MKAQQLYFTEPRQLEIREQELPPLQSDQLLVKNLYSAISAGTEMLVYRGQLPKSTDEALASSEAQTIHYPMQYGYACVGRIEEIGKDVDTDWLGKTVFSFQPHASHHICTMDSVIPLPEGIDPKEAVLRLLS